MRTSQKPVPEPCAERRLGRETQESVSSIHCPNHEVLRLSIPVTSSSASLYAKDEPSQVQHVRSQAVDVLGFLAWRAAPSFDAACLLNMSVRRFDNDLGFLQVRHSQANGICTTNINTSQDASEVLPEEASMHQLVVKGGILKEVSEIKLETMLRARK